MLHILIRDVRRATLPRRSGNEGWIGLSPAGDRYHVVAPVDVQIAKGVMACNWPTDGTPFGGYTGWLYFRCEPYDDEADDDRVKQEAHVRANSERLIAFAESYGIPCRFQADSFPTEPSDESFAPRRTKRQKGTPGTASQETEQHAVLPVLARCGACGKGWRSLGDFLRDPTVKLKRYRVHPEDFRRGTFVFSHGCGGAVEVPVTHFVRARSTEKSLIGSQACPGLCHYETSLLACSAMCEGACYRRIAAKLQSRSTI